MHYHNEDAAQICRNCKNELPLYSRADKKYCDNRCKNAYHNKIQRGKRHERRTVDLGLHRNHEILKRYVSSSPVKLRQLEKEGFNPQTFTSLRKDQNNHLWRVCYNFEFIQYKSKDVDLVAIQNQP